MKPILSLLTLTCLTLLPAAATLAQDYRVPDNTPAHIRNAVEDPSRKDEQRARDAGRKPAEVLTLADINEGDHVAELSTFGQYYTPMLVDAVGPAGKVDMYDMPALAAFQDGAVGDAGQAFADAHPNAEYHVVHYSEIELPRNLDAVYNILSYHDWQEFDVEPAQLNADVFDALKPGGKYIIVDHLAENGSGWKNAASLHRIDKNVIIDEVEAAGFDLIVDSNILANPDDDRKTLVFDPAIRGVTDRAVLVFRKP